MLRVTIEFVPFGIEREAHPIAQLLIINEGTGNLSRGNYRLEWRDLDESQPNYLPQKAPWLITHIKGWPRTRTVWQLVERSLKTLWVHLAPEGQEP